MGEGKQPNRGAWRPWEGVRGGRIWVAEDGHKSYYVRATIRGSVFQARLNGTDPIALADQLRRFWADPAGFDPRGPAAEGAIYLDGSLQAKYLEWCAQPPEAATRPRNHGPWIAKKRTYLRWWGEVLSGRDLRRVTIRELRTLLRNATNYKQRVSVIKHFYAFLREEEGLKPPEDPTFAALKTPPSEPAQYEYSKAVFTPSDSEKVIAWLEAQSPLNRKRVGNRTEFSAREAAEYLGLSRTTVVAYHERGLLSAMECSRRGRRLVFAREQLDEYLARTHRAHVCHRVALAHIVLAGTMWHATEVVRFSKHGRVDPLPTTHKVQNGAAAVLICEHKGQFLHPTAVSERVSAAARELVELGGITIDVLYHWTKKAVDASGVPSFAPGQYRHAVSTYAGNQGAEDAAISKALGHKTETTAKRFYTTRQVPPKVPTFT